MTTLAEQVSLVARLRAGKVVAEQRATELKEAFTRDNHDVLWQAQMYAQDLNAAETELREMAVAAFKATGDRRPASGIAIQMRTRLEYHPEAALNWAIENHRDAVLALKRPDFERLAKALAAAGAPDALWFVEQVQEPACTIATDLSVLATVAEATP